LDKIYHLHGATIQHGHESERIYVMSLPERNEHRHLLAALEALARENNYGKIIAKVPATAAAEFKRAGYRVEARVPGYYRGAAAALFMARYPAEQRACTPLAGQLTDILDLARSKAKSPAPPGQMEQIFVAADRQTPRQWPRSMPVFLPAIPLPSMMPTTSVKP
jgi:hypothetical protein